MSRTMRALMRAIRNSKGNPRRLVLITVATALAIGSLIALPPKAVAAVPEVRTTLPTGVDSSGMAWGVLAASGTSARIGDHRSADSGKTWMSSPQASYAASYIGGGKVAWMGGFSFVVETLSTGARQTYQPGGWPSSVYGSLMLQGGGLGGVWAKDYLSNGASTWHPAPTVGATVGNPQSALTPSGGILWYSDLNATQSVFGFTPDMSAAPSAWTTIDGLHASWSIGSQFAVSQTELLYALLDGAGLHLCSRPLADLAASPSCSLADNADYSSTSTYPTTLVVKGSMALVTVRLDHGDNTVESKTFAWSGTTAARVRTPVDGDVTRHFVGDAPYVVVVDADGVPTVRTVNIDGTLSAGLATLPTVAVSASLISVAPDRVVGADTRDGSTEPRAWTRSVGASGFGTESALPHRASNLAASAGRTAVAGVEGLSLYDRGALKSTLSSADMLSFSGPYVLRFTPDRTGVEVVAVTGAGVATFEGSYDGQLFGSRFVAATPDGDLTGSLHVSLTDVTGATPTRTVNLPAGTAACSLAGVWDDLLALACGGQSLQVFNAGTGTLVGTHSPTPGGSSYFLGLGDGYVLVKDRDVDYNQQVAIWNLSANTVTPLTSCVTDPVTDGVGHVECESTTQRIWMDFSAMSTSAPRLLGALAAPTVSFAAAGSAWSVEIDTTKALAAGSVVISKTDGTPVRSLPTTASADGSVRGVSWDGLDSSGRAAPAGTYTYRLVAEASDGSGAVVATDGNGPAAGSITVTAPAVPGAFASLSPSRILDTRTTGGKLKASESRSLQVTGRGGVPDSGVSAVVLNVTVTETTSGGYLTVSPTGTARPTVSNLNWGAGTTIPNAVTVKVGEGGKVDLFQSGPGTAQVIVDVAGYYRDGTVAEAGGFTGISPARLLDTRTSGGRLAAGESRDLQITGAGGVPASNVSAVILNVTVTETTSGGYLTAYPEGTAKPLASNLNWSAGATIPNLVTVKVGDSGKVSLFNSGPGTAQVIADVAGYYLGGTPTQPGMFVALAPSRVLDTRSTGTVAANADVTLPVVGKGGIPATGVSAVVVNTTVTETAAPGYLTVYPGTSGLPTASNLNWTAGVTIPNLVTVQVGTDGTIKLHNGSSGTTQIIADTAGYYLG